MSICVYNMLTGDIVRVVQCAPGAQHRQIGPGEGYVIGLANPATHYVCDGLIVPRAAMSPIVEGATVSNLPVPCTVTIERVTYEVDDGTAEIEFAHPGPYAVTIRAVGYLDTVVTLP